MAKFQGRSKNAGGDVRLLRLSVGSIFDRQKNSGGRGNG